MNIGYACALLEKQMEVLVVNASDAKNTVLQLQAAKFTIDQQKSVNFHMDIVDILTFILSTPLSLEVSK